MFRRCHQPCNTSEDCPLDDRSEHMLCVIGEQPDHVCQLDADARCEGDADCPGKQICAVDDRCRDECAADRNCMPGQLCRQASCAEPDELVDGLLVLTSASGVGKPCGYNSQCPPGPDGLVLFCRDGRCDVGCFEERDCPPFYGCTSGSDPNTPGNCELIGPRGQLYCDPDHPELDGKDGDCSCLDPNSPGSLLAGAQLCKPDGSGYEACQCN